MKILGKFTIYFSCFLENKIDHYDLTDEEKKCIENRVYDHKSCSELNLKNIEIIKTIELQKQNEERSVSSD